MDPFSFMSNSDIESIDQLYRQYIENPDSIDESWRSFFRGFDFARQTYNENDIGNEHLDKEFKVLNYIDAFRKRGHLFTKTNPVRTRRKYFPTLDLENYGLTEKDLDTVFHAGTEIGIGNKSLREIVSHMDETYCQSIGAEYMFIRTPEKTEWLQQRIESTRNNTVYTPEQKKRLFHHLKKAVGFESFIHKRFVGQKRFSLEGTEVLIPALYCMLEKGSDLGIEEYFIGMEPFSGH
jgi:2-oxoglutarate dehydrogenase E1 component